MTQKEIAEILEVEATTVSKYEKGTLEPSIESLKRLSNIFEVTINDLLDIDVAEFDASKINILQALRE